MIDIDSKGTGGCAVSTDLNCIYARNRCIEVYCFINSIVLKHYEIVTWVVHVDLTIKTAAGGVFLDLIELASCQRRNVRVSNECPGGC